MKSFSTFRLLCLAIIVVVTFYTTTTPSNAVVNAFVPSSIPTTKSNGWKSNNVNNNNNNQNNMNSKTLSTTQLYMGGKMSKFGIFSPAVYVGKVILGNDSLNKIRGKAISLHSQYIGDFCTWIGAYHLRTQLIKKAKVNGDILGFLV